MLDPVARLADFLDPYWGIMIGVAVLAGVLLLNQLIFRHRWKSYQTRAQYLAANPTGEDACNTCGQKPARLRVSGRGYIYRCTWCETELYRVDGVG